MLYKLTLEDLDAEALDTALDALERSDLGGSTLDTIKIKVIR